jgi:branched-subunit amino acid ABC-type transport system permease component
MFAAVILGGIRNPYGTIAGVLIKNNFEIPDQIDSVDTKIVGFVEKWMSIHPKHQDF